MKMLLKSFYFLALSLVIVGCGESDGFEIKGINTDGEEVVIVKLLGEDTEEIDTLDLDEDGSFVFAGTSDGPAVLLFSFDNGYRVPVVLKTGKEKITFTIDDPKGYGIYKTSGSPEAERLQLLQDYLAESFTVLDSLDQVLQDAQELDEEERLAIRASADQQFMEIIKTYHDKLIAFIDADSTSLTNLFVFNQRIGNMGILDIKEDLAYFDKVERSLVATFPEEPNVLAFSRNLKSYKQQILAEQEINAASSRIVPGADAPDITLQNPDGKEMKLSELKGKVVLVDFWASWCQPCRAENPNLVRLYDTYNAKGFEIFSVSLDGVERQQDPRGEWLKAIEADNLKWNTHVSDLSGWNTPLLQLYGFTSIPFTILVDREGKIIQKNLRGEALEAKLKELF
ncbi:MAG: AhpC/TSA family protein [Schleiferiaceae bacterium]|nr:AhpC/TSA family protein [Schleiferiaceae bacterium]